MFSHGFGGERRQSTHFCTHLASHGYVVAAMDHVGNTTADMMQMQTSGSPPDAGTIAQLIADRPADASFVIDLVWDRPVPTLYLTAELDTLLPLDGMRDLLSRTPEPRQGVVLRNADHFHFCDRVEETHDMFKQMGAMLSGGAADGAPELTALYAKMKTSAELCPGAHAYALTCGLGLAHMDAHLSQSAAAAALLEEDLVEVMSKRGVVVELL